MTKKLNYFWPNTVYKCNDEYYISRPWFKNELSNNFEMRLFCQLNDVEEINEKEHLRLNKNIDFVDFFEKTSSIHFLLNYNKYKNKIFAQTSPKKELYFVHYPYRKTSILLAKILSDYDLTIWVQSDYVGLFGINHESKKRSVLKRLLSPAVSNLFPKITKNIFKDNIIFYTGDIIYDEDNHLTQYEFTSLSRLNQDSNRITTDMDKRIVFVGTESKRKGLNILLDSLEKTDLNLKLTIIGMDSLDRYSEYENNLNIQCKGVIYDQSMFYDCLSKHDVLIMPSICEKQGKVQIEAMSTGVVPICADSGGTYTTIDNYYTGLLFREGSCDDLVSSIEEIYNKPHLYQNLQENGLEYISELSLEDEVKRMATIIKNQYDTSGDIR